MTRKQPVLDWPGIKAELHRRGMTLTALGEMNGINPSVVRRVSSRTHYGAQKVIAAFIDRKPEDLWPDRYPRKRASILDTAKYPRAASQKSHAVADNRGAA